LHELNIFNIEAPLIYGIDMIITSQLMLVHSALMLTNTFIDLIDHLLIVKMNINSN